MGDGKWEPNLTGHEREKDRQTDRQKYTERERKKKHLAADLLSMLIATEALQIDLEGWDGGWLDL